MSDNGVVAGNPSVGTAVRQTRLRQGITLRQLAKLVGVSPATVSGIENGKTGVSVRRLNQLAEALSVNSSDLLAETEEFAWAASRPAEPSDATHPGVQDDDNWREFKPLPIDAVLGAAIRAFMATGYHGASMRSISKLANMSVPGVYHHYPSKQALLSRILEITMQDLIWRMERAGEEGGTPTERLLFTVQALALYHTRRSELAFIGASEMRSLEPVNHRRIAEMRVRVQHTVDQRIADLEEEMGVHRQENSSVGKAIATMCTALPQWFRASGPVGPEEVADEYARFALQLVLADAKEA